MNDPNKSTGRFITIEGIDGSGKSTLTKALQARSSGRLITTFEPSPRGSQLLHDLKSPTPVELLLAFMLDRAQHVKNVVQPALDEGKTVICDRYMDSTWVYQVRRERDPLHELFTTLYHRLELPYPHRTILLDLPVNVAWQRIKDATDIGTDGYKPMEDAVEAVWNQRRASYTHLAYNMAPDRFRVIDATQPPDTILKLALEAMHT